LHVRVRFVRTSWPSLLADHGRDAFDLAASGISVTPERAQVARFSVPYHGGGKTPIARCTERQRFDTLAPFQLIIALERLGADGGAVPDRWALWGRDDVYPLVSEVFDGYAAKVSEKAGRTFLGSYHVGLAWRLGRLEEARVQLTEARLADRNPSASTLRALRRLDELERERKRAR
jgi:hypothetical protein